VLPRRGPTDRDRANLAYRGTVVTYGRGMGVVVANGDADRTGPDRRRCCRGRRRAKTPLQKRLVAFGKKLAVAALAVCAIVFAFGCCAASRLC